MLYLFALNLKPIQYYRVHGTLTPRMPLCLQFCLQFGDLALLFALTMPLMFFLEHSGGNTRYGMAQPSSQVDPDQLSAGSDNSHALGELSWCTTLLIDSFHRCDVASATTFLESCWPLWSLGHAKLSEKSLELGNCDLVQDIQGELPLLPTCARTSGGVVGDDAPA